MDRNSKLVRMESEAGVIASLFHSPNFYYLAEELLPNHFADNDNKYIYAAIVELIRKGVMNIDTYNIVSCISNTPSLQAYKDKLSIDRLQEFFDTSEVIARHTEEEYKELARNVMSVAQRRDVLKELDECKTLCYDLENEDFEQDIYGKIDDVMLEYSSKDSIPPYRDLIDGCWDTIKNGVSGIPFKFPTLNNYSLISPGELFIFGAPPKQGKSVMLLNCAVDLMKKGYSVMYLDSELNTTSFTARLITHLTGIEYRRVTTGNYSEEEADSIDAAIEWLKEQKFTHAYVPMFDPKSIYKAIKKVNHTQGIDVLIIDYFKSSSEGDAFTGYQELGKLTDMIKNEICGELGICGIGAAQATATYKLADSAKIARNASVVAIIKEKTDEEIEIDGKECGNKKLQIVFNRNGPQMKDGEYIDLKFDGDHILYTEAQQHVPHVPY